MKSVFKEILIILLLCCAICLILGVIFYDYIPNNKVIPSTVEAYKTSNTVKEEISQEVVDYPKQTITFEITDSDLTLYKQDKNYDQGKANPFAQASSSATGNNQTSKGSTGNNTKNENNESTNNFFNTTGIK